MTSTDLIRTLTNLLEIGVVFPKHQILTFYSSKKQEVRLQKSNKKLGFKFFLLFLEEKKVKKFLEDNYQHRQDLVSPLPEFKGEPKEEPRKYPGVGPKTREGNFLKLF